MIEATFPIIKKLGYEGSLENYLKIENGVYWKWREYREKNHVEMDSNIWWEEILDKINVKYTINDIHEIKLASHQKWRTQISLYPKVKELLLDLKKRYKLALISNIAEGNMAREDMNIFGILEPFDIVVMSSDFNIRKPDPKIFEHVLEKLNIKKEEMIFIGDTLYDDVQGAKAAKLRMAIHVKRDRTYFFSDYYIEPDRIIYNLKEIYEILNSV